MIVELFAKVIYDEDTLTLQFYSEEINDISHILCVNKDIFDSLEVGDKFDIDKEAMNLYEPSLIYGESKFVTPLNDINLLTHYKI